MTFFIIPIAIALLLALLSVHDWITDPRGHRPPPASHHQDPQFTAPTQRLHTRR